MFVEPRIDSFKADSRGAGWIEVICGSMFSGKTEELIRRLNRAKIAKQKIEIYKPAVDTRYHETSVVSHNDSSIRSTPVQFADDILLLVGDSDVVGIDEAQFFDMELIKVARTLANKGKRVILAGLDMDFKGEPFGPMPGLMGIAEFVTKVHAICMKCGGVASYSYRLTKSDQKVLLGEQDAYEARCRNCFYKNSDNEG
ncbi:MAG: thymidine kinase [Reichenbachiella sp.]|uniref:thymidine kinase n=1 Tax=Reichenbachiella sp. TaxID=2184521 RepID=UPI002966428E|nr:thymidine kinase [Reichenbachiella sp.]MDW3208733.1 thymidine kinase [Reichenbachiella sp.]